MASEIKLPRLGQGMESGVVTRWLKREGEQVEKGEPLFELDTDKVTQEVESPYAGVLLKIALAEGEAPVGTTLAYVGAEGERVPDTGSEVAPPAAPEPAPESIKVAPPAAPEPAPESISERAPVSIGNDGEADVGGGGRTKASPLARKLARERGLELAEIAGTGPEGRIVAEDVARAAVSPSSAQASQPRSQGRASGEVERVPLTSTRRTIARRLSEAWQAPAFQIIATVDMSEVLAMRRRLRERARPGERNAGIADFLTKACAQALAHHPSVNALWLGDAVEIHHSVDIGIATATERGLIVPVIRGCERQSLAELAAARAELVSRTLAGALDLEELEGGTFTISNLGTLGVEQFVAVLNPPQVAIIAAGAIIEQPVARSGKVEIAPLLTLTLTCDHRAVDGSLAAEFLATVKGFLEEPGLML